MGLFSKKKKDETDNLSFGFPAAERKKEVELTTPLPSPGTPEDMEPSIPEREMPPAPQVRSPPPLAVPEPRQSMPEPMPVRPVQPVPVDVQPVLDRRPVAPSVLPEDIEVPSAPVIQKLRPHVFLKINKYKEVMSSIDRIMNYIRDLRKSLKNVRDVEEKEALRLKESEELLIKLDDIASAFDKIFSSPEK